jgi:hypothetical protein
MAGGTIPPPMVRAALRMVVPSGTSTSMPSKVILAIVNGQNQISSKQRYFPQSFAEEYTEFRSVQKD